MKTLISLNRSTNLLTINEMQLPANATVHCFDHYFLPTNRIVIWLPYMGWCYPNPEIIDLQIAMPMFCYYNNTDLLSLNCGVNQRYEEMEKADNIN